MKWLHALILILPLAFFNQFAGAAAVTTLHTFTGGTDGAEPIGSLVLGSDSNYYGTAYSGGVNSNGAVFKISPQGTLTPLYSFTGGTDGSQPVGGLVQGFDGNFYGTTISGGVDNTGEVFMITSAGTLTPLYSFTGILDGAQPYGGLVQGIDSNFYGTTYSGGLYGNGTVFKMSSQGSLTTIHEFTGGDDGGTPTAALVQGVDSNFYGTAYGGGLNGSGTVFRISSAGLLTVLHSFGNGPDGAEPFGSLLLGSDTNFYGTTYSGGSSDAGTVFKLNPNGTFSTMYSFGGGNNGGYPISTLVEDVDGNFLGTAAHGGGQGAGTVFLVTPAGKLTTEYTFAGGDDGAVPEAGLVAASVSNFLGSTSTAGADNDGTVFSFVLPCNFTLSASHITFSATANSGTFSIGDSSISCTWTAVPNADWITITSASGGAGSGVVAYAVAPNLNATGRTGEIAIGGKTFAITQQPEVLGQFLEGTYTGLVIPIGIASNATSGSLSVKLSKTSTFSASLTLGGVKSAFKGAFNSSGTTTNSVIRPKLSTLQVILQLLPITNSTDQITGTVSDGTFTSEILADLEVYSALNPAPYAGLYNLVLTPANDADPTVPQGYGYGTLSVTTLGSSRLLGVLADGTKVSVTGAVSGYGTFPLYEALYKKLGSSIGELSIVGSNVTANVNWYKPAGQVGAYYPTGFVTTVALNGVAYVSPLQGGPSIFGNRLLTLSGGNLVSNLVKGISVNGLGGVTVSNAGPDKLEIKITMTTGAFSGSFIHPVTGKAVKFDGVVLQSNNSGYGFFLGTNESGSVSFVPVP